MTADQRAQYVQAVINILVSPAPARSNRAEALADLIAAARRDGAEQALRDAADAWAHSAISPVAFWLRDRADTVARRDQPTCRNCGTAPAYYADGIRCRCGNWQISQYVTTADAIARSDQPGATSDLGPLCTVCGQTGLTGPHTPIGDEFEPNLHPFQPARGDQPPCDGHCATATDLGMPEPVIQVDPQCSLHGEPARGDQPQGEAGQELRDLIAAAPPEDHSYMCARRESRPCVVVGCDCWCHR